MLLRKLILWMLLLLVIAALLPTLLFREPAYGGHSLSEWLDDAYSSVQRTNQLEETRAERAETAIRAIGTKAIPHLLRMLSAKETSLGELRRELHNAWRRRRNHMPSPWQLQRRGFVGLQILGPAAAPAVPKIIRMLEADPKRMDLWIILDKIGEASAGAAPLLERSFPELSKNPDFAPSWLHSDFHPQWLASDLFMSWGGSHRERLAQQLHAKTNLLLERVTCLWALRKDPEFARQLIPSIVDILSDPSEPPLLKIACLHALGRIPSDRDLNTQVIVKYEAQFGRLAVDSIRNGDFSQSHSSGVNPIPADPSAPSVLYTNWFTWNGVIGRNLAPAWAPGLKIELGPRSPPGSISQVFRTSFGTVYRLQFQAATGRNLRVHVAAGDLDKTFIPSSSDPGPPAMYSFEFRAVSPLTTLTISALDDDGYGPFIDNVVVAAQHP